MSEGGAVRVMLAGPADDARALLLAVLRTAPLMVVVGTAAGWHEIEEMNRVLHPDAVLMNIGPGGVDGVKATRRIMESRPVPIIVVTGGGRQGRVTDTLNALSAGALAVVALPPDAQTPGFAVECRNVVSTIRSLAAVRCIRRDAPSAVPELLPAPVSSAALANVNIVAIAASTGGPGALRNILAVLPGTFQVPIVIVQHIAKGFIDGLVDWLNETASVCVKLAEHGERLAPGTAYLAPDGSHLGVSPDAHVVLSDTPPIGGFKPSATHLFDSVSAAYGSSALGVMLTGMGEDGVAGLRVLKSAGGYVLAQDEFSSVVFGMPGSAISDGLVDVVIPLEGIGSSIMQRVVRG